MVRIQNKQKAILVDTKQLKKEAEAILKFLEYPKFDLGILIATDEDMHLFNRDFRGKDKPTDILSFPFYTELTPGERIEAESREEENIGDIIIAPNYVTNDAPNHGQTFEERMRLLLVHGICHLLGYDHETDEDFAIMQAEENRILAYLSNLKS